MPLPDVAISPLSMFREASRQLRSPHNISKNDLVFSDDGEGGQFVKIPSVDLELHIKINQDGKPVLSFDYMAMSDLHLGTRQSRAKRTSQVFEHTDSKRLDLVGDINDGEHFLEKEEWKYPEWHRQALAHILRKAAQGTDINYPPGNHDVALRKQTISYEGQEQLHHNLCGKTFLGIKFSEDTFHTDPCGRRFQIIHGDQFDDVLFGRSKGFLYHLGSVAYDTLIDIDIKFQSIPRYEHISLAAIGKRITKTIINRFLGVRQAMMNTVDNDPSIDGIIYGHSHMEEMVHSPKGKLIINDGCCTEHVQSTVHDRHGTWANLEWHKDRLIIKAENGQKRIVSWSALGFESLFKSEATLFEDIHTRAADNICRLMYRLWPPKERQRKRAEAEMIRRHGVRTTGDLLMGPIPLPPKFRTELHDVHASQSLSLD